MKTISVMTVRKSLGEILDEVNLKSETFILERAGKPIAKITPLNESAEGRESKLALKALRDLRSINANSERGKDPDSWLNSERSGWN